jgi:uncharacterized protein (UPF0335 family)
LTETAVWGFIRRLRSFFRGEGAKRPRARVALQETHMSDPAGVAADQLKSFVERIERLEEEKQTISDDIKDVYAEAKGNGFDVKILRQVIRIRKQDKSEREEMEALQAMFADPATYGHPARLQRLRQSIAAVQADIELLDAEIAEREEKYLALSEESGA